MTDAQAGREQVDDQDKAGHKRLPVHLDPSQVERTRFKKGQSGNPAGRKKGQKLLATQIQEMLNDSKFIDKLNEKIKTRAGLADVDFQDTPMKAIITVAMIEAMDQNTHPIARSNARTWLQKAGYGTKVDITSDGQHISETPKVISVINVRRDDVPPVEAEAS